MTEVEGPDGVVLEFPDGTSQDVMRQAMERRYGAPKQAAPDEMAGFIGNELAQGTQPKSFGQEIGALAGTAGRFADDTVRQLAEGATFGFADKIAEALGGQGAESERAKTRDAADRLGPLTTAAAQIAGGVAPVGRLAQGVGAIGNAARALPAIGRVAAGPLAQSAATGALAGAATGLGHDRDIGTEAAFGLGGGVGGHLLGNALASGLGRAAGAFNRRPAIPTRDAIHAAKDAAYGAAENAGVMYTPQAVDRMRRSAVTSLTDMGYDPALQPGAAAVIRRIDELEGQNVTLKGIDTLRKVARGGYQQGNAANNAAVERIVSHIDDLIENPTAGDILAGDGRAGADALRTARGMASREFKLDRVDDAVNRADLRAASTGSGGNVDNATRQNLRRLLERPRGFTGDERQSLETVVRGTPTQSALRLVGKLSPSGNGLMAALGIGGTMANPAIGIPMLTGMLAKPAADRMTARNVDSLRDIIAAGGSRAATQPAPNAVQRLTAAERERLARILSYSGAITAPSIAAAGE